MIRCSRCGRRLAAARPSCPIHGEQVAQPAAHAHDAHEQAGAHEPAPDSAFVALGYRLRGVLGRGGFATVYAAERLRDGLTVAIKLASREQGAVADHLAREAAALATVGPPHVPVLYERGTLAGRCYLALEYLAPPTLAERLAAAAQARVPARIAQLARPVLDAVEAIHARGIVHLDLKPENVFLGDQGRAKVIDFGLSRDEHAASSAAPTSAADDAGTAEYISPEQCAGRADLDRRADLYSLGVMLYELIGGAPPFWGTPAEIREAHRSRRPAPLLETAACPRALEEVIRRCLAKDRAQRFQDVAELRDALEAGLAHAADPAPSCARAARAQHPSGDDWAQPKAPEQRSVGLVSFVSYAGPMAVQRVLNGAGGQIAHMRGSEYVAAFGHDVADNPAQVAVLAAQAVLAVELSRCALVDVATVSVWRRPDGGARVFGPVFARKDGGSRADPHGVIVTRSALEVLPQLPCAALEGRPDRFLVARAELTLPATSPTAGRGSSIDRDGVSTNAALPAAERAASARPLAPQAVALVGRDDTLRELTASARRAFAESVPALATVYGEPGMGRTALAGALARQLRVLVPESEVVSLTAQENMLGAVSRALPDLLRRLGVTPAQPAGANGDPAGEQVWAAAAFALGWLDAEHPAVRRLAAAPGVLRLALARAAGEALRQSARARPIALLLDDAQLADEAMLDALEYATLKEGRARVWVCAFVRPGFEHARPTWATRAGQARAIALGPLAQAAAVELARQLLLPAEHVPPRALSQLAARSDGVPRLLVELVGGLKRDGLVRRSERGLGYYLATDELAKLPELPIVQWAASREIELLPPQLAAHARLASVLGAQFAIAELEALLQRLERDAAPDDALLDAGVGVERLLDANILTRQPGELFEFRHALLRDTIYRQLPEQQRARLHRCAFEGYRSLEMSDEQRLPRLAAHAARCGETAAAASAYLELAARALAAHAYLEAEAAFGGALANLSDGDERALVALRGRGVMRFRLGRHEDALKDLRRARTLVAPGSELELELCLDQATVLDWMRDFAQSAELVHAVSERAREPAALLAARLAMSLARVHHRRGEALASVRLGRDAVERARRLGDAGYETAQIALLMLGPDCAQLGQLDEAERHFEAVIAQAEARADLHHLAAAHLNRSLLWFARRDVERLFQDLARVTEIGREVGSALIEYAAVWNRAEVEYALGELERASEDLARSSELARKLWGDASRELGTCELLRARIALYRGELAAARELSARIRARMVAPRAEGLEGLEFFPGDQALLEMVELAASDADESAWRALETRCRELELQPHEGLELLEQRALAAFRQGQRERSRELFKQALALDDQKPSLMRERVARKLAALFPA